MTDENKLIRDASKGVRARQLLDDEMLVESFKALEDAYTTAWRNSHVDDGAGREKMFLAINILGQLRNNLKAFVTNGRFAEAELKSIAFMRERKKRLGIF